MVGSASEIGGEMYIDHENIVSVGWVEFEIPLSLLGGKRR